MELITPALGLIVWTSIVFIILLVVLRLIAWKPILGAVIEREKSIEDALNMANKAREQVAMLKAENDKVLKEAKLERDAILKEGRELRDKIVADAKDMAQKEADNIMAQAKSSIENEKLVALNAIRSEVVNMSLDMAEKVLKSELSDKEKQSNLVNQLLSQLN